MFLTRHLMPWLLAFVLVFQGTMAQAHAHGLTHAYDPTVAGGPVSVIQLPTTPAGGGGPVVPLDDGCNCPICHVLQSGGAFVDAAGPVLLIAASPAVPIAAQVETRLAGYQSQSVQPRAPPLPH